VAAIVTVTPNPSVDVTTAVGSVVPTEKLRCGSLRHDPGGGGINVARVLHELGGEVLATFLAGGATGQLLEELLEREGIARRTVLTGEMTRESFTVFETETGREYRFVLPGPTLGDDDWRGCLEELSRLSPSPRYLVASGSLPPGFPTDAYAQLARASHRMGARLVLDTSGEALEAALQEKIYLLKPNRRELEQMTGESLETTRDQELLSHEIVDRGQVEILALTLGADGALLTWNAGQCRIRPPAVEVKSAVGAGDSFVAGMVLGLVRGKPLPEAFCLGVAAGTAALLTPGTELCRREDVERLHEQLCPLV
jgi:6-phosphofructokinase 2